MIKYADVREDLKNGDILMVKATGLISRIIRSVTGESINHVAMVISNPSGVFVYEMKEGIGYRMSPMSQWLPDQKKKVVLWGKAPEVIRELTCIEVEALTHRAARYSYWTLITVWIGQFTRRKHPGRLVCSTFVQTVWLDCGYKMFDKLADPGDFLNHAVDINQLQA